MLTRLLQLLRPSQDTSRTPSVGDPASGPTQTAARLKSEGNAQLAAGRLDAAVSAYREAIALSPNSADLHVNLGFVLKEQGLMQQAEAPLRKAAELDPGSFDARYLLGMVLAALGQAQAAVSHLEAALELRPDFTAGHSEICRLMLQTGQVEKAKHLIRQAILRDPDRASLHMLLGNLHAHSLNVEEAVAGFDRAIALEPSFAEARSNLGLLLEQQGRVSEAVEQFKKATELAPDFQDARSNLLYTLSYDPATSPHEYLEQATRAGDALLARAKPYMSWAAADAPSDAPLRVGMVCGGFRMHPIGHFLEALLAQWSTNRIELYAYASNPFDDALTARLRPRFAAWRSVTLASDEDLARQIHADGIQILIDLAGHTDHSRLPVLAWKPAPVQVSWLGFFASTGLRTIDWFIADPISVPEAHHSHFIERIWNLPDTRLCFMPPADAIDLGALPALTNGIVTFGCFQRLPKINDDILAAWGGILQSVPGSRLRLQSVHLDDPGLRARFLARCTAAGIDLERLQLHEATSRERYLAAHNEIDILLDTYPYTGATTTCEALWMGVPTVTIAGDRLLARQGASLLECVGLHDWIATDHEHYVHLAARHARSLPALAGLRHSLRERFLASPLCDGSAFAGHLQSALLGMWDVHRTARVRTQPGA